MYLAGTVAEPQSFIEGYTALPFVIGAATAAVLMAFRRRLSTAWPCGVYRAETLMKDQLSHVQKEAFRAPQDAKSSYALRLHATSKGKKLRTAPTRPILMKQPQAH